MLMKSSDKWWLKVKPGDTLTCKPKPKKNPNKDSFKGGAGYKPNLTFEVNEIEDKGEQALIWIKNEICGVYSNSIINPFESNSIDSYKIY